MHQELRQEQEDKIMPSRYIGIGSVEDKECGCIIKRYRGGRVVREGCRRPHLTEMWWVCAAINCGKIFKTKPEMIEHREQHFIA